MPIAMSMTEWSRITRWTDQEREDPEVIRRREYVKYLDATSKEMTKNWPNSLENVNKRNEELRRARIEVAEQANTKFYKKYLKRQKEEQERLMYSARDVVFKNKDAPKLLLSAVIETAIQKERIEQLKFLEERRRYEAEKKNKEDDEIIRKAKEWNELLELRKKRRFDVNKQHQKEILDQAHEVSERNRMEHETELNLQKMDNLKANEQIEAIKEFEDEFKAAEKARIWADMERARRETEQRRREQAARDRMDDRLIDVLLRSRARIQRRRQHTEAEIKNEKLRVLESISKKLESGDAAREAKEQAILDKAVKEKEDAEEARRQSQQRLQARLRQERQQARADWLRDEDQRLREFNTMRQWQIMNRFKNEELYDDFKENLSKEKQRKINEYKEDILKLWKERDDRDARARAETRYFYGELAERKLRDADNKLLAHAALLLREAEENGRPTFALHRAIDHYCKLNRLYPMPELPKSMQEHFQRYAPRDGSQPEPGYALPQPPPHAAPPAPPRAPPSAAQDAARRDGLQQPQPGTSKPEVKAIEGAGDYRRAGSANGLQRNVGQADITLPAISVVPCKTEGCRCPLKK